MKLKFTAKYPLRVADLPGGALFITLPHTDKDILSLKLSPRETDQSEVAMIDRDGKGFTFTSMPRDTVVIRVKLGDVEILEY